MSVILNLFFQFFLFFIALTVHEFSHALIAYRRGDSTAKSSGRLTLNPLAHIDPVGTFLLPLGLILTGAPFVFGWAKPVPVNYAMLNNPKQDMMYVGLAGPLANLVFAIFLGILLRLFPLSPFLAGSLEGLIFINLILAVFNLIPVPPLDGSRILMGLLPYPYSYKYAQLEPYGIFIIILLILLGVVRKVIFPLVWLLYGIISG